MTSLFEQLNITMVISKAIKTSNFVFLVNVLYFLLYIYIYTFLKYIVVEFKFIQFYKFVEKLELYHQKNNCN